MPNTEITTRLTSLQTIVSWGLGVVVALSISMVGGMLWLTSSSFNQAAELRDVATETHSALCTLKNDIKVRHDAGVKFVNENPDGIPGISRAQLDQSLNSQRDTLRALGVLDCSTPS